MPDNDEPTEPQTPPGTLTPMPLTRRTSQVGAERPPLPPDVEEQFNQLMQSVQALSAHFLGESTAGSEETLRERGARRIKKFQRVGSEPAAEETSGDGGEKPAVAGEASDPVALNKNIAFPRSQSMGEQPPGFGVPERWRHRSNLGFWVGAQAVGLLLLLLGYLIGTVAGGSRVRNGGGSGRTAAELFTQPEQAEQAIQTANDALHAEHSGDQKAARKIYETALDKHVALPGINYRLALLGALRNDVLETTQRLERSIREGERVADCCYVLARLAADKGDFGEAANQLRRGARAQPFEGKWLFYWAEALRRQGKPQAAIPLFEQALDRPFTADTGDLYLFKERLAKVALGDDGAFNEELANHLKEAPVAGEWMLLAAAGELDRATYDVAAEHLKQAEVRLPSALYATLTRDFAFQAHAAHSEVATLLNRVQTQTISLAGPTVIDPGAWLPERGDPAVWQTATKTSGR